MTYDFAKEMNLDKKTQSNESTRDRTLIKLFRSLAIKALGISNIIFLSFDPNELCNRLYFYYKKNQLVVILI